MFLTRNWDDAWDLLQDTLLKTMTHPPPPLPPERVRAWLSAVMSHLHVDRCRKGRRQRALTWDPVESTLPAVDEPTVPAWQSIESAEVRACIEMLDPHLREPYRLQTEEGLTLREIAERLGLPSPTVGTRLHRARRRLRLLLTRPQPTQRAVAAVALT
jgi:RNA polymerase sigma-70 factor (ECF subfamily)